jgi:hypothetical protein
VASAARAGDEFETAARRKNSAFSSPPLDSISGLVPQTVSMIPAEDDTRGTTADVSPAAWVERFAPGDGGKSCTGSQSSCRPRGSWNGSARARAGQDRCPITVGSLGSGWVGGSVPCAGGSSRARGGQRPRSRPDGRSAGGPWGCDARPSHPSASVVFPCCEVRRTALPSGDDEAAGRCADETT